MADEPTVETFLDPSVNAPLEELAAVDAAVERARALLGEMHTQANTTAGDGYTLHEIPGVGRYAIPSQTGWKPILKLLRDPAVDIDFSVRSYPMFDGVLDDRFDGAPLSDPLHDEFDEYQSLRDNIAAVRNFLMQLYFSTPPHGLTADKAEKLLVQIAGFVGDGLHNNLRLFGAIPNHDPTKPFISLSEAKQPDGRGAQYIYEKILEMQRHSNWLRPFDAVVALFGGKPYGNWMLPPADQTPFRQAFFSFIAPPKMSNPPTAEEIAAQQRYIQQLEARRLELQHATSLTLMANDLNAIGNHLLYTSDNLNDVAQMAEPVRREAVEIAKDILRKLKIALGDLNILDGLKLKPQDDMATLGAIKGVVMVYERLVAWARGIDPTILQHPSVMAATRAVGQLGYLSKLEAYRLAKAAGNSALAEKIKGQLSRIPPYFSEATDTHFGSLLDKVERGIDTVMNRVHEVSGPNAMLGHKASKDISSFMHQAPTAGQAMQLSSDASSSRAQKQMAILEAQDMAERAQAQRIQAQAAQRAQQAGQQQQPQVQSRAPGRQAVQQAKQQASRPAASSTPTNPASNPGMNAAQRAAAQQNAFMAAKLREQEDHQHPSPKEVAQKIDPRIINNIRAATSTSGITGTPVTTNRATYETQQRAAAAKAAEQQARDAKAKTQTAMDAVKKSQPMVTGQSPNNKGGRGI